MLRESRLWDIVRACVKRELTLDTVAPDDDQDLVESGALDSMGWVGVLECIEKLTGSRGFAERIRPGEPHTIRVLVEKLKLPRGVADRPTREMTPQTTSPGAGLVAVQGWGVAFGEVGRRRAGEELCSCPGNAPRASRNRVGDSS